MAKPIAGDRVVNATDPLVIEHILTNIRSIESRNDYGKLNAHASASGAYQFTDSTWRAAAAAVPGAANYARAYLAPPPVQDAVAAAKVRAILATHNGSLAAIPVIWYYPTAWGHDALMDKPAKELGPGNTLTVREYAVMWLHKYDSWVGFEGDRQTVNTGGNDPWYIDILKGVGSAGAAAGDAVGSFVSLGWAEALGRFLSHLVDPGFWKRIGIGALGILLAIVGLAALLKDSIPKGLPIPL